MISERSRQRYEAEKAEYEQKMADRVRKEKQTGKKTRGRDPRPPKHRMSDKEQVNFTDPDSRIMHSRADGWQLINVNYFSATGHLCRRLEKGRRYR